MMMKTLNTIKMKIMVRAFRIRIRNGEDFTDIAADYPALTADDLDAIRDALGAAGIAIEDGPQGSTWSLK